MSEVHLYHLRVSLIRHAGKGSLLSYLNTLILIHVVYLVIYDSG